MKLKEIAALINGRIEGNEELEIKRHRKKSKLQVQKKLLSLQIQNMRNFIRLLLLQQL
ncbi:MAG: hypothetical protein R3A12_18170 [Ignavibacteria bacterium]